MYQAAADATQVVLALMASLVTGTAFQTPIGFRKDGTPIWPMAGGDGTVITAEQIGKQAAETFGRLQALVPELQAAKDTDTARYDALKAETDALATEVGALKAAQADAQRAEDLEERLARIEAIGKEIAAGTRTASKAALIGGNGFSDMPEADGFLVTLMTAQNPRAPIEVRQQAEQALKAMGSVWMDVPAESHGALKATTGSTDANGGYLAPRAVVRDFTTVGVAVNAYRSLMQVVTGINSNTIDIPHIGLAPSRATVISRGSTKTNVDVSMANYSATFYTIAVIHDAANQWLRQTAGQGERLIRTRLAQAVGLGEAYYILNGSGTSEPKGLLTSLGASGTWVTSHTAANNTIAGNAATAIAKASGAIANRNRTPSGVVMNAGDFWTFMAQGDDAAGFYIAPMAGASSVNAVGSFENGGGPVMRVWGLPVYSDTNMPADSLVVGAWGECELYIGPDLRIDTSSEAGTRWDQNLTGFRAEEDMAFNADPYVNAGYFQRIVDAVA